MKTKVYAVSSGSYSDWRIESMHWTKESAEKARDVMSDKYRAWSEGFEAIHYTREPNKEIDEFEIDGEPPRMLLGVWNKLIGGAE